ncbi:MAG: DNA adenine methylase [Helicobacteraceae bacterium]|jgi:site-specific DNA-adenine methylase|nr:DNA adenine methylase [Helicobacteraceae bacterium]
MKYRNAPLRFIGQKRHWIADFTTIDFTDKIVIDLFGGSGLLSHHIKAKNPKARVIWNDFDNYAARLAKIEETERLRLALVKALEPFNLAIAQPLNDEHRAVIKSVFSSFSDYDKDTAQAWFMHQMAVIDIRKDDIKYYNLRKNPLKKCADYLAGVERISADFRIVLEQFRDIDNAVFVCDPPYIFTHQATYRKKKPDANEKDFHGSFGLKDTIDLIKGIGDREGYIFTSEKSELDAIFELLNIPYKHLTKSQTMARAAQYIEELYFINGATKTKALKNNRDLLSFAA